MWTKQWLMHLKMQRRAYSSKLWIWVLIDNHNGNAWQSWKWCCYETWWCIFNHFRCCSRGSCPGFDMHCYTHFLLCSEKVNCMKIKWTIFSLKCHLIKTLLFFPSSLNNGINKRNMYMFTEMNFHCCYIYFVAIVNHSFKETLLFS